MSRRQTLFAVGLLCAAGCVWRSYGTIMAVHLDVLTETADKLCSVVAAGRGPTTEEMAEYVYPAQRGREFLRQFSGYRERQSYQQFGVFLDHYEALVHEVDAARARGGATPAALPHLSAERQALEQLGTQIRAALRAGK